jgi:hypothetical protein
MKRLHMLGLAFGVLAASSAQAQQHARNDVPAELRPPAGMCRVWIDGVPAAQQPAPTDCASAVRNRPAKARVIFGDDFVKDDAHHGVLDLMKLPVRGLATADRDNDGRAAEPRDSTRKVDDRKIDDKKLPGRKPDDAKAPVKKPGGGEDPAEIPGIEL